jgi:hypothetical protein
MQANPAEDWQRLTEHYRAISDEELKEIAAHFVDLTETAQQVLRNELRDRGLAMPRPPAEAPQSHESAASWSLGLNEPRPVDDSSSSPDEGGDDDRPHDYTWKTQLCDCTDQIQAWQIHEVLQRAGIESWVEPPRSRYSPGIEYPRIMVAADQLEAALQLAAKPIPQEIVEESQLPYEEFEAPKCPKCGAEDPVLESVDPVNRWSCEGCGKQWADPVDGAEATGGKG